MSDPLDVAMDRLAELGADAGEVNALGSLFDLWGLPDSLADALAEYRKAAED